MGAEGRNSRVRQQFLPHANRIDPDSGVIRGKTILTDKIKGAPPANLFLGPASVIAPKGMGMFVAVQQFKHKPEEIAEIGEAIKLHPDLLLSDTSDFVGWGFVARQEQFPQSEKLNVMDGAALRQTALDMIKNWHPNLQKLIREADSTTIILTNI